MTHLQNARIMAGHLEYEIIKAAGGKPWPNALRRRVIAIIAAGPTIEDTQRNLRSLLVSEAD